SPPVAVERRETIADDGVRVTDLDVETHVGTHVDAPSHTVPDGETLDELPLATFDFEARVVDCTGGGAREAIRVSDLPSAASLADATDCLVVHTGWDDHWGTARYRDHPYLTAAAAEWCATRGLAVGLDTFGPDPTPSADADREGADEPDGLPAHHALLGAGRPLVENLRGLDRLPERVAFTALPLSIPGADGSPVRAVARPL
ncbi:MAG: cyclase family protein, partial [Haloarculaceae archaeon]